MGCRGRRQLTFDNARAYGLGPHDLVSDELGPCQALSAGLRADPDAPRIVVAPSAALAGTRTMVLLGPRVSAPYDVEINHDPEVDTSVAPTAALGSSLLSLVAAVHYKHTGVPHAASPPGRPAAEYVFDEPAVTDVEYVVT